jgi:hypothetical protein
MESDYRRLQQSDNNSVMQNQMCIQALRAVLSVNPIAKSSRVHHNTVASKSGLLTKPIVKGAFRDPGEIIIVVIPWLNKFQLCFVLKVFWGKSLFKFMSNKDTKLYAFFYILK